MGHMPLARTLANATIWLCLALSTCSVAPESTFPDDNNVPIYVQGHFSKGRIGFDRRKRNSNNARTTINQPTYTRDDVDSETSSRAVTSPSGTQPIESDTSLVWPRNIQNDDIIDSNGTTEDLQSVANTDMANSSEIVTSLQMLNLNESMAPLNLSVLTNEPRKNDKASSTDDSVNVTFSAGNNSTASPVDPETITVKGSLYTSTDSKKKDKEAAFTFQPVDDVWYVCHGIMGTIIEIIGVIGNIMCIIVLSHPDMRSSTSILLKSLAVYDIVVLTSYFLMVSLQQIFKHTRLHDSFTANFHQPSYPVWFSLASIAFMGSSYTTVVISVERFIVVTFPLRACIWCTETRARLAVCFVFLLTVLYNIPRFMVFNMQAVWDEENQKTVIKQAKTEFSKTVFYEQTYSVTMNIVAKVFIPLAVLTTFSCLMLRAVLRKKRVGRVLQHVGSNHSRFTAMATAVMLFSLVSLLTGTAEVILLRIHRTQFSEADACEMVCAAMSAVSELMAILNSGINFLLFCFFGSKFREVFRKCFCSKKYKYPARNALGKDQSESKKSTNTTGSIQMSSFVNENP